MIRFEVTPAKLRADILAAKATFFTDAAKVLAALPKTPKSSDFKSLWSDIKQVYIDLQRSKCCFCEKSLEAKIEQDVEHFRPKAAVTVWNVPSRLTTAGVKSVVPAGGAKSESGYTQLAYQPLNYAMACKQCNSVMKKNYFPIAGKRKSDGKDPTKMSSERAYLIYPVGDHDDDPEDLITFKGLSPVPKAKTGFDRDRALVTIELFKLDNVATRRVLFKGRAYLIRLLYLELEALKGAKGPAKTKHQTAIDGLISDECPFANCLRSFKRLYGKDSALAGQYADECLKYINTKSLRKTPK